MSPIGLVLPAIGMATLIGTGLFLLSASRHARRPAKGEHGLTPVYCEQAGGRFNGINWTMPFGRVATFEGFVSISCIIHEFVLKKGDVTSIERERHLFSVGLRLHHHRPELPSNIVLWPRHTARLEAALKASLEPTAVCEGPGYRETLSAIESAVRVDHEGRASTPHRERQALASSQGQAVKCSVEERVLSALKDKLMRQEFFDEFCREFAKEMKRLRMEQRANLTAAERELRRVKREIEQVVDAIVDGMRGPEVKDRMARLQYRKEILLKQVETVN